VEGSKDPVEKTQIVINRSNSVQGMQHLKYFINNQRK
jgi:hypothetical protein